MWRSCLYKIGMILYINSYKININGKLLIDNSLPKDLRDAFATIKRYGLQLVRSPMVLMKLMQIIREVSLLIELD